MDLKEETEITDGNEPTVYSTAVSKSFWNKLGI